MNRLLLLLTLTILTWSVDAQMFQRIYADQQVYGSIVASNGDFILVGNDGTDFYAQRIDQTGSVVWSQALLDVDNTWVPQANSLVELPNGNLLVAGSSNGQMVFTNMDANGNVLNYWFYAIAGFTDNYHVELYNSTYVVAYGMTDAASPYPFIALINHFTGVVVWSRQLFGVGSGTSISFNDVVVTSSGYIVGVMQTYSETSAVWAISGTGTDLHCHLIDCRSLNSIHENADGTLGMAGTILASNGGTDALYINYDISDINNPSIISSQAWGSNLDDMGIDYVEASDGEITLGVQDASTGSQRIGIYKLMLTGLNWAKAYGGNQAGVLTMINEFGTGGFGLVGYTGAFSNGADKGYVLRTNNTGVASGCWEDVNPLSWAPPLVSYQPWGGWGSSNFSFSFSFSTSPTDSNHPISAVDPAPTTSISPNDPPCFGDIGGADLTVFSGTQPYTYLWSNGYPTQNLVNAFAGTYDVTVTDFNGCIVYDTVTLTDPTEVQTSMTSVDVTCAGASDGSIDLTASGGTPGYTYAWSYNNLTSEDLTGLPGGFYQVVVTDANGCEALQGISVNEPSPLSAGISGFANPLCNGTCDGSLTGVASGGTSPYGYMWSNGSSNQMDNNFCAGNHLLTVTDNNGCTAIASAVLVDPDPLTLAITATDSECGLDNGSGTAVVTGGDGNYTYTWSNGGSANPETGFGVGTHTLDITDGNGCALTDSFSVGAFVQPVEICVVTVDTTSTKNTVVWEKPGAGNIAGFKIYRDVVGLYQNIAYVHYDSLSQFTDSTNGIDPNTTSYRYKITVVDTCGNESDFSNYHETIHLTSNQGTSMEANLVWDDYEGLPYTFYRILKDSLADGNWQVLDSVPSTNFTYTDWNPGNTARYLVEVVLPNTCTSTRASHNTTRSNRTQPIGGGEPDGIQATGFGEIVLYPNPNQGEFQLSVSSQIEEALLLQIVDLRGRQVHESQVNVQRGENQLPLNVTHLDAGMYHLRLSGTMGAQTIAFVKR